MKNLFLFLLLLFGFFSFAQDVWVNGYTKSNGTYVSGYYRTPPNSTVNDNYSTVGNVNPYTGKVGYLPRDSYSRSPLSSTPILISNQPYYVPPTPTYTYRTPNNDYPKPIKGGKYFKNDNGSKNYTIVTL